MEKKMVYKLANSTLKIRKSQREKSSIVTIVRGIVVIHQSSVFVVFIHTIDKPLISQAVLILTLNSTLAIT